MSTYDPKAWGALCDQCPLRHLNPVPPEGNIATALMGIVGEAPGFQEVRYGRPFVGPSGKKLGEILQQAGLKREQLWISNAILCRAEVPGMYGKKRYDIPTYLAWLRVDNRRRRKAEPPEPEMPSPYDCCGTRLYTELGWLEHYAQKRKQPNGAVVMPLGNFALRQITGNTKITRWRGSPIPIDTFKDW